MPSLHSKSLTDMVNMCYGATGNRWANFIAVDYHKVNVKLVLLKYCPAFSVLLLYNNQVYIIELIHWYFSAELIQRNDGGGVFQGTYLLNGRVLCRCHYASTSMPVHIWCLSFPVLLRTSFNLTHKNYSIIPDCGLKIDYFVESILLRVEDGWYFSLWCVRKLEKREATYMPLYSYSTVTVWFEIQSTYFQLSDVLTVEKKESNM